MANKRIFDDDPLAGIADLFGERPLKRNATVGKKAKDAFLTQAQLEAALAGAIEAQRRAQAFAESAAASAAAAASPIGSPMFASAAAPSIPSRGASLPRSASGSVKAFATVDANGNPVAGSRVFRSQNPGACTRRLIIKESSKIARYSAYKRVAAQAPRVTCARSATTAFKLALRAKPGDAPIEIAKESASCKRKQEVLANARAAGNAAAQQQYQSERVAQGIPAFLRCAGLKNYGA